MSHTPGPWVIGQWVINESEREAQKKREPYWTLEPGSDSICQGPFGRKALDTESIVAPIGYEVDGISVSEADASLICAAPEMLEALKWTMQTIHQAHHEGSTETCGKNTCEYIRSVITRATGGTSK